MPNSIKSIRKTVRFSPGEYAVLKANADLLSVTVSDYIRALIQLPISIEYEAVTDYIAGRETSAVLLFDRKTYPKLTNAINAWGRHYNQGIHALNRIAAKKFLSQEDAWEMLGGIKAKLEEVQNWTETTDAAIDTWPIANTAHVKIKQVK